MNIRKSIFSPCRGYRYSLWRRFQGELIWEGVNKQRDGYVMWCALNPSTADENVDDNTLRRCQFFAKQEGFGEMVMTNLFAYRATDPKEMKKQHDPVGVDNDRHLLELAHGAEMVICAWGGNGKFKARDRAVLKLLETKPLYCLRITENGFPEHPLYLPSSLRAIPFKPLPL